MTGAVHTKGRKKGQNIITKDDVTLVVTSLNHEQIEEHVNKYCAKKKMQLYSQLSIAPIPTNNHLVFNCQNKNCDELSISNDSMDTGYCSNYCRLKAKDFS